MNTLGYIKRVIIDEIKSFKEEIKESKFIAFLILVAIIGLLIYLKPFPDRHVYFLTGYPNSDWTFIAKSAQKALQDHNIETSIITTEGAVENVIRLNDQSDIANAGLTYGLALNENEVGGIYSLGSVGYEPVWILYNKKIVKEIENLDDLAKYRVGLGPRKSGSYRVAKKVFEMIKIDVENNPHFFPDSIFSNRDKLKSGAIDVLVIVSTHLDMVTQDLLKYPDIAVFNFKNALAFSKKDNSLVTLSLPADSISIANKLPPKDVTLLATTTSLVVKKGMHPDLQLALLMATKDANRNSASLFFAKRDEFPGYRDPSIPISPVAERFYDYGPPHAMRYLPYWLAGFIDRAWLLLLTILAVFYPLSKLNIHFRKYRFSLKEIPHYEELLNIERKLLNGSVSVSEKNDMLKRLDEINAHAIEGGVPISEEAAYFNFLNAIFLLKVKIRDSLNESQNF